ncbi:MATE efflux family protein 1-like isoform 2 [Corchorus olitorius]|uniref:MATE efflux family protein 1-like isoform 2 n=1 Tax=Corchorus olitorius TaxID=93759 RepID=A0A1R3KSJ7_9ROSI|nr:MATE efflux family protein 1-like isoform 2 [Corchorus olitorius]
MAENRATQSLWRMPLFIFFKDARLVFRMDSIGVEILRIAFPAALALAADPIASLIDTAFIGRIGPVELAAVGVSIAIFNQASRITIFPLVSITTSFVAEEDTLSPQVVEDLGLEKTGGHKTDETKDLTPQNDNLEIRDVARINTADHHTKEPDQADQEYGLPYAKPSTKILDFEIPRRSCSSSLLGHARGFPRI